VLVGSGLFCEGLVAFSTWKQHKDFGPY